MILEKLATFTKKKALTIVFLFSFGLFLLILGRWLLAWYNSSTGLATPEGRQSYLTELGWEIDPGSEEYRSVTLPKEMDAVLEEYNSMQTQQGFNLKKHLGEKCAQYTYRLTNYPNGEENVYLTLYVQGRKAIAGDIHSNSLSGFMHGIIKQST